ncbi:MAG: hypothetical protein RLY16_2604 [Bacteroidota bacterium]|jgi:peptidoglycan/LPS O-acetylase OafA/YrhL
MQKILAGLTPGKGMLRLILAFSVMLFHTLNFFPLGHYAVFIFFVLSGYWIFKVYEENYSTYKNAYWVYLRSRIMRIAFIYWLVLSIAIVAFFSSNGLTHSYSWQQFSFTEILVKNLLLIGINTAPVMFVVPAWSLEVEIQFYVLAPMLIWLHRKIAIQWQLLFSIVLLLILVAIIPIEKRFSQVFLYLPFFLAGAWLYYSQKVFSAKVAGWSLLTGLAVLMVHFFVPLLYAKLQVRTAPVFGLDHYQDQINILLVVLTIPFLSRNLILPTVNSNDATWSSMAFVLYLIHWPLLRMYNAMMPLAGQHHFIYLMAYYLICILAAYVISATADRFFEELRRSWLHLMHLTDNKQAEFDGASPLIKEPEVIAALRVVDRISNRQMPAAKQLSDATNDAIDSPMS